MEWVVALALLSPALILAAFRNAFLLDYVIWVLALNRGIRRLVDYYYNGHFNPLSPISLVPLLTGGLLLVVGLTRYSHLTKRLSRIFGYFFVAVTLGFLVGLFNFRAAALYSLGEWIAGLGTLLFVTTQAVDSAARHRWIRTAGWAGIVVASYGIWQYYTIPSWDAMWLEQSGMIGYMGVPEPTKMTCFSTLNERGPCAAFLAWALIPMLLNSQWRNVLGWLPVPLLLFVMMLTQVRSMFIVTGLVALLHPLLSRGEGLLKVLILAGILVAITNYGLEKLPGGEVFSQRLTRDSLAGANSSLAGRFDIYGVSAYAILTNPIGYGLGSSGMGNRVIGSQVKTIGDAGYLQIVAQFGWIGGSLFFSALFLIWKEISLRFKQIPQSPSHNPNPFPAAARAILIATLVFLFVADVFAGFSLVWIIFGCAMAPASGGAARGRSPDLDRLSPVPPRARGAFSVGGGPL